VSDGSSDKKGPESEEQCSGGEEIGGVGGTDGGIVVGGFRVSVCDSLRMDPVFVSCLRLSTALVEFGVIDRSDLPKCWHSSNSTLDAWCCWCRLKTL